MKSFVFNRYYIKMTLVHTDHLFCGLLLVYTECCLCPALLFSPVYTQGPLCPPPPPPLPRVLLLSLPPSLPPFLPLL